MGYSFRLQLRPIVNSIVTWTTGTGAISVVDGRGRRRSIIFLFNVVAGDPPLSILVEHRSYRLYRRLLVLKAALVLNHHILAIGRAGHRRLVSGALELTR